MNYNLRPLFLHADPEAMTLARLSRSEAYTALRQYRLALKDAEFCCGTELLKSSAEVGLLTDT